MKNSTKVLLASLTSGAGLLALGWLQEKPQAAAQAVAPVEVKQKKLLPALPVTQPVHVENLGPFADIGALEKGSVIRLPRKTKDPLRKVTMNWPYWKSG